MIEIWYVKWLFKNNDGYDSDIMQEFKFITNGLKSLALLDTKDLHEVCCKITITL